MNKKYKCCIFGYGYMGEIRRQIIEANENLELTIICETNPSKIAKTGNFKILSNYKEALDSDIDIAFVATPNNIIPEIAIEAMNRGIHVFCEKPPGRNLADIINIKKAEEANLGVKLMFGFNHRYHPAMLRARAIIDSNALGKVVTIRGNYGKSGGKNFKTSWRNSKEISGGGILLDQGIHMLDLFNFFVGGFNEVKCVTSNNYWKFEVEDNALVILKNKNNQTATLHSSATFWKHSFEIYIFLEKGYLEIKGFLSKSGSYGRERLIIGKQQFEDEAEAVGNPSEEIIHFDRDLSWQIETDLFIKSIINDIPVSQSTSQDALDVMRIIDSAYKNAGG